MRSCRKRLRSFLAVSCLTVCLVPSILIAEDVAPNPDPKAIERGKYLAKIAGCNDCHTEGYLLNGGKVPQEQWLLGNRLGWRGPWGTTYSSNLRIFMAGMSEDAWVDVARTFKSRPPMPFFALNEMHEEDLRAIYQFIRSLGEVGNPAPAFVPPGDEPKTPYALFPSPEPEETGK